MRAGQNSGRYSRAAALAGVVLVGTLLATGELLYAQRPARIPPALENISYGPHERNVLDLWQAKSDTPTPLLIFIHGGGFVNGSKEGVRGHDSIKRALDAGVSFASINYRFREHAAIQDILRDAARAVQFIRSRSAEWSIDPARIASYGSSAGAGTSLWLAFHDDLADPNSDDPVLRQSSRLIAAGSLDGQASYDLRDWEKIFGPSEHARSVADQLAFYRFATEADARSPEGDRIMRDCSMWGLISSDDPPVVLTCMQPEGEIKDRSHYVHHPKHAIAIADRCKDQGVEVLLVLRQGEDDNRGRQERAAVDFLIERLSKVPAGK